MRHRAQQAPEASEPPTDLPAAQETPSILSILRGSTSHFLPCFCSCPRPLPSLPLFNAMPALEAHDPRTLTGSWDRAAALLPTCKTPDGSRERWRRSGRGRNLHQGTDRTPLCQSASCSAPRGPRPGASPRDSIKILLSRRRAPRAITHPGEGAAPRLLPSPPPCRPKDGRGGSGWGRCPRRAHGARLKGR